MKPLIELLALVVCLVALLGAPLLAWMGDLIDTLLGAGAGFDWISPVGMILGNLLNGPSYTFLVPGERSPLSGREIQWMLGKRGVKTWGAMVVSGTVMFSVKLRQARWAQHLLEQAGVPIENPLPSSGQRPGKGARQVEVSLGKRRR